MGTLPGLCRSAAEKQLWLVHPHLGPKRPPQQARVSLCASIHHRIRPGLWLPLQPRLPIAGQVNGQRKELEYTQKQSSATTKSLLGFWHLTISKIHQEESLYTLVFAEYLHRDCCFIAHVCIYVLTQATPWSCKKQKVLPQADNPALPLQILLPQGPAQQVGESQHFGLCKEDLGWEQSQIS